MRVVVDTNVIAYFLLGTQPFRHECARFWRAIEEPVAPAFIAAYDTLFVELAEREGGPLATFDKPLLKAFPKIARRPRSIASAS